MTLLGADEINGAAGRLVRSRWLEYLPFLGAFVIANQSFREKQAGYNLYNITQGIHTTDIAPWFTRWMKSQDFETTSNFVRWSVCKPQEKTLENLAGFFLGFCLLGFLLALTIVSYDWYGFANALSMVIQIAVRSYMLRSVRYSIDTVVQDRVAKSSTTEKPEDMQTYEEALRAWQKSLKKIDVNGEDVKDIKEPDPLEYGWNGSAPAKVLFVTADARAVTMVIPNELLIPESPMIANLKPSEKLVYEAARWSGWIAFAVQVITLGQAALPTQIITVALMVIPTVLFVMKFGCDDSPWRANMKKMFAGERARDLPRYSLFEPISVSYIGSRLKAEVYAWPWSHEILEKGNTILTPGDTDSDTTFDPVGKERQNKRQHMYACLQLTNAEEDSMEKWDLFPHERGNNEKWMVKYKKLKIHIENVQKATKIGIRSIRPGPTKSTPAMHGTHRTNGPTNNHIPISIIEPPVRSGTGASTAQDGSDLDPAARAEDPLRDADFAIEEPQSAVDPPVDPVDNIRPVARASTMPISAHGHRRLSQSTHANTANWMTKFNQDHEDQLGAPR